MIDRKLFALPLAIFLLAGCAGTASERYPSLATRDVERAEGTFEPVPGRQLEVPQVPVTMSGSLDERLAALVEQARGAHAEFTGAVPAAERRVGAATGSAIGSDRGQVTDQRIGTRAVGAVQAEPALVACQI